jgi:hypothetical protein
LLSGGLDESFSSIINVRLTKVPLSEIEENIKKAEKKAKANPAKGMIIGEELIKKSSSHIRYLKDILGLENFQYQSIADKLANKILDCGICYWNETKDIKYSKVFLKSYKYALTIANSGKTKNRIKECIRHCKETEDSLICKVCNTTEISTTVRVKMYKMKWDNSYSYFKEGGYPLEACSECAKKINIHGYLTFIYTAIPYGLMYLWVLDLIALVYVTGRFPQIFKWIRRKMRKISYGPLVFKDPAIRKLKNEGYKLGMP